MTTFTDTERLEFMLGPMLTEDLHLVRYMGGWVVRATVYKEHYPPNTSVIAGGASAREALDAAMTYFRSKEVRYGHENNLGRG